MTESTTLADAEAVTRTLGEVSGAVATLPSLDANLLCFWMDTTSRIPITDQMRAELELCKYKTGFGITALFHFAKRFGLFQQNASLSPNVFNAILYGRVKTVIAADFDKVIEAYNAIPREMWGKSIALSRKGSRVPVTDGFKARLQAMLDASSITRAKLLGYYGAPPDLTSTKLGLILKRENTTMKGEHAAFLERVLERRTDQPDPPAAPCPRIPHAKPKPPKKEPYRSIKAGGADFEEVERAVKPYLTPHSGLTPLRAEDLDAMKRHKERTGISPKLLVSASPDAPLGLRYQSVDAWIRGKTKSVDQRLVDWVIAAYSELPDKA